MKESERDHMDEICKKYGINQETDETVDEDDVEGEWSDVK